MAKRNESSAPHVAQRIANAVFGTFGFGAGLICAALAFSAAGDLVTGDSETSRGTLVGLVVLFTGGSLWGFNMARSCFGWRLPRLSFPAARRRQSLSPEQRILEHATSVGGRVTVVEVAGRCGLTLDEAEALLNRFAAREAAELLVAEDGTAVYDFNVLTRKEKQRAEDIL
jgi:hypothetical protein